MTSKSFDRIIFFIFNQNSKQVPPILIVTYHPLLLQDGKYTENLFILILSGLLIPLKHSISLVQKFH